MTALSSGMYLHTAGAEERPEEAYCGWTLRDRLELLAFDADAHPHFCHRRLYMGLPRVKR
jgi:hypothetical protein